MRFRILEQSSHLLLANLGCALRTTLFEVKEHPSWPIHSLEGSLQILIGRDERKSERSVQNKRVFRPVVQTELDLGKIVREEHGGAKGDDV